MNQRYTHNNAQHFRYEKTTRPFHGSLRRATIALTGLSSPPTSEEQFLDVIRDEYPHYYVQIEWVKFHQFAGYGKQQGVFYRLAVVNLQPDPVVREDFFIDREEITRRTGWYPLIQGSRAKFYDTPYRDVERAARGRTELSLPPLGSLRRLMPIAASDDEGNSFLVTGDQGTILLDCGMHGHTMPEDISTIFLSHFHRDHAGGVWPQIDEKDVPIILSQASLNYLCSIHHIPEANRRRLAARSFYPSEARALDRSDGVAMDFFPVFHCPGAYGIRLEDKEGTALTYFGDLCLKNGFHDFTNEAFRIITKSGKKRWVILDATLAGRRERAIDDERSLKSVVTNMTQQQQNRSLIFVSNRPETLLYSYIQAFSLTTVASNSIKLFIAPELYRVLRVLWKPVIFNDLEERDPVVRATIGRSLINFAETQRLYPLVENILARVPITDPCIIFASPSDIARILALRKRVHNSDMVLSGTLAVQEGLPAELLNLRSASLLRIVSSDWSFHSDEVSLANFIQKLTAAQVRVVLFHNYPDRLERFIQAYHLDPDLTFVASHSPIDL
jgi:glyoxylase-like metal-dependent hydrolase (beta-lactamase superfamily II)